MSIQIQTHRVITGVRDLFVESNGNRIVRISWNKQNSKTPIDFPASHLLIEASAQIQAFLEGGLKQFDLPIAMEGGSFELRVWNELRKIPYGSSITHLELSERVLEPLAVNKVAKALAANPLCLILPCHRVVAGRRNIGEYSGGVPIKKMLLELENSPIVAAGY